MNQGDFDNQGDALGWLIAAPLGRKHKLRNIKTRKRGTVAFDFPTMTDSLPRLRVAGWYVVNNSRWPDPPCRDTR